MLKNCTVCDGRFETSRRTTTCSVRCLAVQTRRNKKAWNDANKEKISSMNVSTRAKRRDCGKAAEYRKKRRATKEGYVDRFMERATSSCPETDLTREYLLGLMESGACCVSGVEFTYENEYNCFHNPKAPSIDRIDSNKGYFKGNVQIILACLNRMKNDMPNEDFLVLWRDLRENAKAH